MDRPAAVLFAVLALLVSSAPARAAEPKVDLSNYLLVVSDPRDVRNYEDENGKKRRLTTNFSDLISKHVLYSQTLVEPATDDEPERAFVQAGVIRLRQRTERVSQLSHGSFRVLFPKPTKLQPMKMRPGKPYRFNKSGLATFGGTITGRAKLRGSVTFLGFEPLTTPAFDYESVAVLTQEQTLSLRVGPNVITAVSSWTRWISPEHGLAKVTDRYETFFNGVSTEVVAPTAEHPRTFWFVSGVIDGTPVP